MRTIRLDIDRPIKWTMRAECRLGSLPRPPNVGDIGAKNRRTAFYALCCHIWACVDGIERPEDIAEFLDTPEKQLAAIEAFYGALTDAGVLKPKNDPAPTGSGRGLSESSNLAAKPPTSGS